jgi:tRNA modification GTPase
MYKEDTIAAIATPMGEGAVAIVRISGPEAEAIASTIFVRRQNRNSKLRSHTLYYGSIRDPRRSRILDNVLLTVMRQPRSYTGEPVVEIHCHGGAFLVRQILGLVLEHGARHADRGEFTKRAFLNGRIDLSQAEAVLDLIRARTDKGIDLAVQNAEGLLSKLVLKLREELLDILVQVEAAIDFPEEEIELLQRHALIAKTNALKEKIGNVLGTYEWGRLHREGARVCICGRPNVGKSSLLNALLGATRVIVSASPGTTRDVIEDSLNLDGLPVVLWDTAGIRETEDAVERIGVSLSRDYLAKADAVVVVLDGSESLTRDDISLLVEAARHKSLIAINKTDLRQELDLGTVKQMVPAATILHICAKDGFGIDDLKMNLRHLLLGITIESPVVLDKLRQKDSLLRGYHGLTMTIEAVGQCEPPEMIAVTLQEVKHSLEEVVGAVTSEDILERIFNDFCIGK